MSRARICPQCSSSLQEVRLGTGTVWTCPDHGVKRWFFDGLRDEGLRVLVPDLGAPHEGDVQRRPWDGAPPAPPTPPGARRLHP